MTLEPSSNNRYWLVRREGQRDAVLFFYAEFQRGVDTEKLRALLEQLVGVAFDDRKIDPDPRKRAHKSVTYEGSTYEIVYRPVFGTDWCDIFNLRKVN